MWPVYIPPVPAPPDRSQELERHLGMHCICLLIDCCHNEMPEDGCAFTHGYNGHHMDSGTPASGYLYPWEPGDESWRTALGPVMGGSARRAPARAPARE